MAYDYEHIDVVVGGRVATVTISNPPINLITPDLYMELMALSAELKADSGLTVVIVKSADPDFFLAHFDVGAILEFPTDTEAERDAEQHPYHLMCERFRTMDKVTIAQIEGRVGGGGSELAASMDMRFGVKGKTIINQMEVPLGILPGGTGTQRLPRLVGRGRAMEIILGGDDLDAETAERWGYLNRIFDPGEIDTFVSALAQRIASFPVEAVRLAKQAVDGAGQPLEEGLLDEAYLFQRLLRTEGAKANMRRFLEIGGHTREGELRVGELGAELGKAGTS
ncbi:MAG: enoyl-CoA hydratase/isomerase family protein [Pseudomonadales bacterium]|jgi:enoyl-CoA hydratase/carnithine racemase|nr:enoyl-CoA hydratase/isomerase family protein [Pseudomonadales bacterium]MDP6470108.1 enoyl-CoA hydratase/isomerase family protein [Pseudomonadales bacterium]MDP6972069.1 enoyl-CoA hydratase/isomerase family protein [Pseudomonadales bacterium]|tara:strand:- start:410 stop:1252 length:843 start_codon:yes stop_codon:yes gene_type:complete